MRIHQAYALDDDGDEVILERDRVFDVPVVSQALGTYLGMETEVVPVRRGGGEEGSSGSGSSSSSTLNVVGPKDEDVVGVDETTGLLDKGRDGGDLRRRQDVLTRKVGAGAGAGAGFLRDGEDVECGQKDIATRDKGEIQFYGGVTRKMFWLLFTSILISAFVSLVFGEVY